MRRYTNDAQPPAIERLHLLADQATDDKQYSDIMSDLGRYLGNVLVSKIPEGEDVCLAVSVEDADFLGRGMLETFSSHRIKSHLACFWNERQILGGGTSIAPIFKRYVEPGARDAKVLVVLKSIISSACVIRANLLNLIDSMDPREIFVVAPVVYTGAESAVGADFPDSIRQRFRFLYLAEDDQREDDGTVIPGIGGNVYQRLGFESQADKNRFVPSLVRDRRRMSLAH